MTMRFKIAEAGIGETEIEGSGAVRRAVGTRKGGSEKHEAGIRRAGWGPERISEKRKAGIRRADFRNGLPRTLPETMETKP
jgi:hypothetical protein